MPDDTQTIDDTDVMNSASNGASGSDGDDTFETLLTLPFTEARARALASFDRRFLSAALARHNGNIARTARSLGLHRQSLQKLMGRRGIKSIRTPATSSPAIPETPDKE